MTEASEFAACHKSPVCEPLNWRTCTQPSPTAFGLTIKAKPGIPVPDALMPTRPPAATPACHCMIDPEEYTSQLALAFLCSRNVAPDGGVSEMLTSLPFWARRSRTVSPVCVAEPSSDSPVGESEPHWVA